MLSPEKLSPAGRTLLDRRGFLSHSATALGSIALTNLLETDGLLATDGPSIDPARPYAPRRPHFPAKAKNVVVIFCAGAVSQLETWDYKPELIKWDDKPLPGGPAVTFQGPAGNLARPQYAFRPRGQTGKWVSDMIPHLAELTDDFAFVHSLTSKSNTHGPAENFLSTGFVLDGFPVLAPGPRMHLAAKIRISPRMSLFRIREEFRKMARITGVRVFCLLPTKAQQ